MPRDPALQARLHVIVRPLPNHIWSADYPLKNLDQAIEDFAKDWGGVNLTPDFQRGHVWTRQQQERFVESLLRGALPSSSLLVQFNCPHWDHDQVVTDLPREIQCIDGLQRITALRRFMNREIRAFNMVVDDFSGSSFDIGRTIYAVKFAMHAFARRADLLQYYIDLNAGGTPHSQEEIARVRELLIESSEACPSP